MEIHHYTSADEEAVVGLWTACDLVRAWNDPRKDIRRKLAVNPEMFLVGREDGRVVATVMAGYEGHRGWINYLAVSPECRRKGWGRAMMAEAEKLLRARDCPKIALQVRAGNRAALEFYRRIGFGVDEVVSLGKRLEHDGPAKA